MNDLSRWTALTLSIAFIFPMAPSASGDSSPAIPTGWSDGYLYANGIRLHYYRAVPATDKPPMVMVHGITDNGLCWATLALQLQDDYDIFLLDARGHGLSDPFTTSDDADTLIKDVVAAIKAWPLRKPIVVGHSMGAHTVMRLGAEYQDLPKAVIMLDPILEGIRNNEGRRERNQRRPSNGQDRQVERPNAERLSVSMFGSPESLVAQNNYSFDELVAKCRRDSPKWGVWIASTGHCQRSSITGPTQLNNFPS